jgi:hypothetical protein
MSEIFAGLGDAEQQIRSTAGSVLTTLFGKLPSATAITKLLPPLLQVLAGY